MPTRFNSTEHAPAIQKALIEQGFVVPATGVWDFATIDAYKWAAGKYLNQDIANVEVPVWLEFIPEQLRKYIDLPEDDAQVDASPEVTE